MPDDPRLHGMTEEERLAEIIEVVVAIARNDFDRRASVGDGTHLLDGLAIGLNMLSEEVQRRHAREAALQQHWLQNERLIAVGQLAAGVAHELNNPAAFVLNNLAVLERTLRELASAVGARPEVLALVEEALDLTRDNQNGVRRIVAMVRELRGFSRLDPWEQLPVALDDVVADACTLVRAELAYRAELEVVGETGVRVNGDRTKLAQVLTNLLLNSAQAIPDGAPTHNRVTIDVRTEHGAAIVRVRDTGSGMTADVQARLFEPFFTTKPREAGTGIGLAISADIVRHHGGELRLVETSAQGTTFEVRLPLAAMQVEPAGDVATPEPPPPPPRLRVLIIDDERFLLDSYARFFANSYDVELALGGSEALARLASDDRWDAILCDLMMPQVDGVAVFEWVSAHRPHLADRMLFCTGGAFTPRGTAFVKRMGHRTLEKPVALDELMVAIERVAADGATGGEPASSR